MKCCLCHKEIEVKYGWDKGNNAEPLKKGRCCDMCNETKVLTARMLQMGFKIKNEKFQISL